MERAQRVPVLTGVCRRLVLPAHACLVPVYCRVVQRSAVLWRQIAVGCRSTDHSDPKQLPGVLQGIQRQTDLGDGRIKLSTVQSGTIVIGDHFYSHFPLLL